MKRTLSVLALGAALLVAAQTFANAQILISVSFQGGNTVALASGDITGAPGYSGGNWNNATGTSGGPIALMDSTGAASPVTMTAFSAGPFGTDGPDTDNSTPQANLFGGALNVNFGNATFALSGLSAFSSYDLVVYYSAGTSFPDARDASFTASGSSSTYYATGIDSVYTAFTLSNSTVSGTFASGNYVVFSGLTDPAESVAMVYGNDSMGLVGFQILGTEAVPEPSTRLLISLGLGGLVLGLRYRKQM